MPGTHGAIAIPNVPLYSMAASFGKAQGNKPIALPFSELGWGTRRSFLSGKEQATFIPSV